MLPTCRTAQLFGHPRKHRRPIAETRLAKQPHRRIPGAVVAIQRPAPVGANGSATHTGTASAPARCAMAVSHVTTRSRLFMIAAVSMKAPCRLSSSSPKSRTGNCCGGQLFAAQSFLQADQADARLGQGRELGERHRTQVIGLMLGASLPGNADFEPRDTGQPHRASDSPGQGRPPDTARGRESSRRSCPACPADSRAESGRRSAAGERQRRIDFESRTALAAAPAALALAATIGPPRPANRGR